MPTLSLKHQERLQLCVIDYLQGRNIINIRECLQNLRDDQQDPHSMSGKHLFEQTIIDTPENQRFVAAILRNLGFTVEEQVAYLQARRGSNLYQLLNNIYHDDPVKNHQLRRLLVEINNLTPQRGWTIFFGLGALISAALGGIFYFKPDYANAIEDWAARTMPTVVSWVGKTLSLLRNWSIFMIAIQVTGLAWTWVATFSNSTTATELKLSRLGFKTLAATLSIAAYGAMFLAAGVTTPLAAGLFIASSAVGLFKSLYTLYKTRTPRTDPNAITQDFEALREHACEQNMLRRNRNTFGTQFVAALLTTAAVAVMSMFPASILLFISCVVFMWLVEQVRSNYTATIHDTCDTELQASIKAIPDLYKKIDHLYPLEAETQEMHAGIRIQRAYLQSKIKKLSITPTYKEGFRDGLQKGREQLFFKPGPNLSVHNNDAQNEILVDEVAEARPRARAQSFPN